MVDSELTQIIREVQKDKGRFEFLYSQIVTKVYYWCLSVIRNEADAKDVSQEVMIRIYNKLDTLKTPETFNAWAYVLTRNYCYNHLKSRKHSEINLLDSDNFREEFESNWKEERRDVLPRDAYDMKETKTLILGFINALPRKQRETITLYYLDDFNTEEIADILGCSAVSVRSRIHSGRKSLKVQLEEY